MFAVITAVRRVFCHRRNRQNIEIYDCQLRTQTPGGVRRVLQLEVRLKGRTHKIRRRPSGEPHRLVKQPRRIHPAGKSDAYRRILPEKFPDRHHMPPFSVRSKRFTSF